MFIKPTVFLLPLYRTYRRTWMKDRGVEKERGKRESARARELTQLFVLELVCLAGCRVLLCNHSIKAERERCEVVRCHTPSSRFVRNTLTQMGTPTHLIYSFLSCETFNVSLLEQNINIKRTKNINNHYNLKAIFVDRTTTRGKYSQACAENSENSLCQSFLNTLKS